MKSNQQLPFSKHFRLQKLADGVYAAIHINGGGAFGNAGIVDLGDRTLIFDTFFTPQAAEDLRAATEALTGRSVDIAINSHFHNDHIWGNQVFSQSTEIVSTEKTRHLFIATKGLGGYDDSYIAEAGSGLKATRTQFQMTEDDGERRQLTLWVDYYQSIVAAKSILQVRAPNLTFSNRMEFHGTNRSAELIEFEGGHTESDAVLFLPQDGIAFMGDLLCIEHHPWLLDGNPSSFIRALEDVLELAPKQLVPGHGPVGDAESLLQMRKYIHTLEEIIRKMIENGKAEETINEIAIPAPCNDWLFSSFFFDNLHYLYQCWLRRQDQSL
jgi:cyclase